MAIKYFYAFQEYQTEVDAQAAVAALQGRMENNPNDWMVAKEITGSADTGWQVSTTKLTDAQLLNPDVSKTYMAYSTVGGENIMPLTASELETKRDEFRAQHGQSLKVTVIDKFDDSTNEFTEIATTTDMSGYV